MPLCVLSSFGFGTSGLVASADDNLGWFKDWLSKLRGSYNLGAVVWGLCNQITCFSFPELSFLSNSMWRANVCPDCDLEVNSYFFPEVPEKISLFAVFCLNPILIPESFTLGGRKQKLMELDLVQKPEMVCTTLGGHSHRAECRRKVRVGACMGTKELKQQMPRIAQQDMLGRLPPLEHCNNAENRSYLLLKRLL